MKRFWLLGAVVTVVGTVSPALAQQYPTISAPRPYNRPVAYQEDFSLDLIPDSSASASQRVTSQLRQEYRTAQQTAPPALNSEAPPMVQPMVQQAPNGMVQPTPMPTQNPYAQPAPATQSYNGQQQLDCGCQPGNCNCDDYSYSMYRRGAALRGGIAGRHGRYLGGAGDSFVEAGCDTGCSTAVPAAGCDTGCATGCDTYTVAGIGWLFLKRDGADFWPLSYENGMPGNQMSVSDADLGYQNGVEAFFARQSTSGCGWEVRYWGLFEDTSTSMFSAMPRTEYGGFSSYNVGAYGDAWTLYNSADYHQIGRESDFHSVELNLLRYASSCGPCRNVVFRGLGGVRVINFNDSLAYSAYSASSFGGSGFDTLSLSSDVSNTIIAAQLGGTGEYCLSNRFRLALGSKVGIGGNAIDSDQVFSSSSGVYAQDGMGDNYNYMLSDSDFAMFGEMNAQIYYHVSDCFRVSAGYRIFGISGVALSQEQLPYDFTDVNEISSINRDGSLIYSGFTLGAEYCF